MTGALRPHISAHFPTTPERVSQVNLRQGGLDKCVTSCKQIVVLPPPILPTPKKAAYYIKDRFLRSLQQKTVFYVRVKQKQKQEGGVFNE